MDETNRTRLIFGDAFTVLPTLKEHSVDAIVVDPPYGLEFLGQEWDKLAVPKTGHLGGFSDGRKPSFQRVARHVGIRQSSAHDATRTARGSGQTTNLITRNAPEGYIAGSTMQAWHLRWAREALRLLRPGGHVLAMGGARTYHRLVCAIEDAGFEIRDSIAWICAQGMPKSRNISKALDNAAGAKRPVIGRYRPPGMAKPWNLSRAADERTVAVFASSRNNLEITGPATEAARRWDGFGTGLKPAMELVCVARKPLSEANVVRWGTGALNIDGCRTPAGRWPANVTLDEATAEALDEQAGESASGFMAAGTMRRNRAGWAGPVPERTAGETYGDSGGASRFFYVAKPDTDQRGEFNAHPTVKPVGLMRWLCRLVTPPVTPDGQPGLVLDHFMGSGTTGVAALAEGFRFLGIEREARYFAIARRRVALASPDGAVTITGHDAPAAAAEAQLDLFADRPVPRDPEPTPTSPGYRAPRSRPAQGF